MPASRLQQNLPLSMFGILFTQASNGACRRRFIIDWRMVSGGIPRRWRIIIYTVLDHSDSIRNNRRVPNRSMYICQRTCSDTRWRAYQQNVTAR